MKSSQSITDLSQIPEKDARGPHGASHLHRYTPSGGKQYAASLIQHQLNSTVLQPSNIMQFSTNPVIIHKRRNPITTLTPANYLAQISKLTLEKSISKTPADTFYNTLPSTKFAKSPKSPLNKTELTRLRSLPLPNTLSLIADASPSIIPSPYPLQCKEIPKECRTSLTTKTVMYSTYHTLPSTKKTAAMFKDGTSTNTAAVVMEITGNICSSVDPNSDPVCLGVQPNESSATNYSVAWVKPPPKKALHSTAARTNLSGREVQKESVVRHSDLSPTKRPVFLNLHSGGGSTCNKYSKTRTKPPLTNQSLPESPVCEDLNSPTGLFQNLTDTESNLNSSRIVHQRRTCSYFIDLNTLTDNEQEFQNKNTKNIAKSSESLPATLGCTNMASSEENLLDSCDEEDNNADFSSDSLEEPSEFSNRTPRRCISDYQIFTRPPELVGYEFERRSASATGRQCKRTREAFHSQESILSNTSGQLSSCNNSGDILEMCANYEQDRHSSASFFLSLRRRNTEACRSQESILTDESEYHQYAPKYDRDRHRDSCRSTESILESDYHFTSLQEGNLADLERTRHRDSCQSTESILTDDSDCQLFMSSLNGKCESKNKLSGETSLNKDSLKSELLNKESTPENKQDESSNSKENNGNHRPIFRTRSLQDTRSSLSTNESSLQPPCLADENVSFLQKGNERPTVSSLVRKNSYPRSRPPTPTSLQMQAQFSKLSKSYTTTFEETQTLSLQDDGNKQSLGENVLKSPQSFQQMGVKSEEQRNSSNRPPTAPKPVGKVTHKPPLKPRQKPSQQQAKQRTHWNNQEELGVSRGQKPLKGNHSIGITCPGSSDQKNQSSVVSEDNRRRENEGLENVKSFVQKEKIELNLRKYPRSEESGKSKEFVSTRTGGVKLLCRSFENAAEDYDISDDCAEEDSFPILEGSGSSTPATSSSAANSPKRLWPPASRASNHRQLGKRLGTRHQILPSRCSGPGNTNGHQQFLYSFGVACLFVCMLQ